MLKVRDLVKYYDGEKILRGIDFSLHQGETLAIMGPSGCGKSTTIRCLNRLTEPDQGEIIFDGLPLLKLSRRELLSVRQRIGFVFQNFNLIARLTAKENVILPLLKFNLSPQERQEKAEAALQKVHLKNKGTAYPQNLSGGEKQRVGIARALVIDPRLILLDEPTAALDPILVTEVLEEIEELTADQQRGVVLVTHEVRFALRVADRVVLLEEGRVVERGSSNQILADPTSDVGRKYKKFLDYY